MHREQAIFEFCLYLLAIGIIGQGEAAHKCAVAAFDAVELPFLLFFLELAFAGDGQDTVFDRNLDEDIALSSSGAQPKSPSDILAGAESELEKTARSAPAAGAGFARTAAAAATAALVSGIAKGKSGDLRDVERTKPGSAAPGFGTDLDFHLDESEKPAPMHVATPPLSPVPASTGIGAKSVDAHAPIEPDKLDFAFNDDRSTFEDATPSVLDGQWHDSATKLDLAKAYQEMGDVEGAREILREVLAEGDSEQKTEAQALIAKLP
jgi:FimV-like protein